MTGVTGSYKANPETDITLGTFVETGSFHANNSFTGLASVKSKGHTDYIGAGVMGHIESASRFHGDAALRAGRVKSDMNTDFYLGAHLGGGYQRGITPSDTLNLHVRYSWNHINSDTVTVLGDKYHFNASNSHRVRGGMRYTKTIAGFTPYAGVAYEYELDGKGKGSVYG